VGLEAIVFTYVNDLVLVSCVNVIPSEDLNIPSPGKEDPSLSPKPPNDPEFSPEPK